MKDLKCQYWWHILYVFSEEIGSQKRPFGQLQPKSHLFNENMQMNKLLNSLCSPWPFCDRHISQVFIFASLPSRKPLLHLQKPAPKIFNQSRWRGRLTGPVAVEAHAVSTLYLFSTGCVTVLSGWQHQSYLTIPLLASLPNNISSNNLKIIYSQSKMVTSEGA